MFLFHRLGPSPTGVWLLVDWLGALTAKLWGPGFNCQSEDPFDLASRVAPLKHSFEPRNVGLNSPPPSLERIMGKVRDINWLIRYDTIRYDTTTRRSETPDSDRSVTVPNKSTDSYFWMHSYASYLHIRCIAQQFPYYWGLQTIKCY